jgi:hypothetical protein
MIIRSLPLAAVTSLVVASTVAAAGAAVTASLTPNTPLSPSGANITLTGPFPAGLPTSLSVQIQPGFTSSLRAVPAASLCTPAQGTQGTCPAGGLLGTGSIAAIVSPFSTRTSVSLKLWLGAPSQPGDISTIYMYGKLDGVAFPAAARVFTPSGGGVELLISRFPSLPPAFSAFEVDIQSLTLNAKAMTTVKKVVTKLTCKGKHRKKHKKTVKTTYSFLANPPSCAASGTWTGTAVTTFAAGASTVQFSVPCAK